MTPIARHRNGRTPLEGCDGWRVPRRTRVIVPGTTSHRNPLATRRPPIVKPLINSPQYPTTGGELSASTEARGWGMNADEGSMITRFPAPWRIVDWIRRRGRYGQANRCVLRPGSVQRRAHRHHDDRRGATDGNRFCKTAGIAQAGREWGITRRQRPEAIRRLLAKAVGKGK